MELSNKIKDLSASQLNKKVKDVTSLLAKTQKAVQEHDLLTKEQITILDRNNKTYKVSTNINDYSRDTKNLIKKFPLLTSDKFKPHHQ
eukprot:11813831-Ditylum_brightwellii.AAC.1